MDENTKNDSEGIPVNEKDERIHDEPFVVRIKSICDDWNFVFDIIEIDSNYQLRIYFWECSPMWIRIDVDTEERSVLLVGVVRIYVAPHERTDYNELISLIWASHLWASDTASVRLIDIPHPFMPRELVGRYVLFDKQPSITYLSLDIYDFEAIESLIIQSSLAAHVFSLLYRASSDFSEEERCSGYEAWAATVRKAARWKRKPELETGNERSNPNWSFYERLDHGASFFRLGINIGRFILDEKSFSSRKTLKCLDGYLITSNNLKNHISESKFRQLKRLLRAYSRNLTGTEVKDELVGGLVVVPIESHIICFADSGIISLSQECGYECYIRHEEQLRIRHQSEAIILHSTTRFNWNTDIADERFEDLIFELLKREPGIRRVKQVGSTRAPDGGRDFIADWLLAPSAWDQVTDEKFLTVKRVIVQCKVYKRSINKSRVGDAVGVADQYDANGYLLIAYPSITPSLVDYLERVPPKRSVWAEWWTRSDIEDRMRKNLDIARRFQDLVTIG